MNLPQNWYYSTGGHIHGPVSQAEIQRLVRAGGLSPTDSVTTDDWDVWHLVGELGGEPADEPQEWYYSTGGEVHGPVSHTEILRLVETGALTQDDPITCDNWDVWHPAGELTGIEFAAATASDPPLPPEPESAPAPAPPPRSAPASRPKARSRAEPERRPRREGPPVVQPPLRLADEFRALCEESIARARGGADDPWFVDSAIDYDRAFKQVQKLQVLVCYDEDKWKIKEMWAKALVKCMTRAEGAGAEVEASRLYLEVKTLAQSEGATWTIKAMWACALLERMLRADLADNGEAVAEYYRDLRLLAQDRDAPTEVRRLYRVAALKRRWGRTDGGKRSARGGGKGKRETPRRG